VPTAAGRSTGQRSTVPLPDRSQGGGAHGSQDEHKTSSDPEVAISRIHEAGLGCREHAGVYRNTIRTIEVGAFNRRTRSSDEEPYDDERYTRRAAQREETVHSSHVNSLPSGHCPR
jgi:hypothetical protein